MHSHPRPFSFLLVLLAALLVAGGCGGGEREEGPSLKDLQEKEQAAKEKAEQQKGKQNKRPVETDPIRKREFKIDGYNLPPDAVKSGDRFPLSIGTFDRDESTSDVPVSLRSAVQEIQEEDRFMTLRLRGDKALLTLVDRDNEIMMSWSAKYKLASAVKYNYTDDPFTVINQKDIQVLITSPWALSYDHQYHRGFKYEQNSYKGKPCFERGPFKFKQFNSAIEQRFGPIVSGFPATERDDDIKYHAAKGHEGDTEMLGWTDNFVRQLGYGDRYGLMGVRDDALSFFSQVRMTPNKEGKPTAVLTYVYASTLNKPVGARTPSSQPGYRICPGQKRLDLTT